jgi:tripartite-type tricarboxylate transporter receptor subunit TctC
MPTFSPQIVIEPTYWRFVKLALAAASIAVAAAPFIAVSTPDALAEPARTIKMVVPLPAGGPVDLVSRLLAEQVARAEQRTVVVENRPGAGTVRVRRLMETPCWSIQIHL